MTIENPSVRIPRGFCFVVGWTSSANAGLTLGELLVFSSLTKTVFLTFNDSGIDCQESLCTKNRLVCIIGFDKGSCDT